MYCTNCGKAGSGNFCGNCGTPLNATHPETPQSSPATEPLQTDWANEFRYDVLINIPEVKDLIAGATANATHETSAEEFLKISEKALSPLIAGVPLSKVAELVLPLYAKWGIKTGQSQKLVLNKPIGQVIVEILCALALSNQKIESVHQASDGCIINAKLPSNLLSFAGEVIVKAQQVAGGSEVEASVRIPGQLYDWGRSKSCLKSLFDHLQSSSK